MNEVESLSAKAARGAGFGWGHAEDLGRAARWLAQRGFDWAQALLGLLEQDDAHNQLRSVFEAADRATSANAGDCWSVEGCSVVWLLPMLASSIHGKSVSLVVRHGFGAVRLHPDGAASGSDAAFSLGSLDPQTIAIEARAATGRIAHKIEVTARRAPIASMMWHRLEAYAARTYVPASVESRATGAGGSRPDTD
ncbi:MAG: DUF3726 domain-containing protein [Pseudomonadota bacterium]|nr:DUF3726 domain-containing protein [Pseudomonadota bacterium]